MDKSQKCEVEQKKPDRNVCILYGSSHTKFLSPRLSIGIKLEQRCCHGRENCWQRGLWPSSSSYENILKNIRDQRSDQLLSRVRLFATPWIAARQASLSITNSQSSLRLTSIESVMPSSHLILCHPLLLLPPIPPSIRVFSNESAFRIRWSKYWSFSFSISPSKEHPGLISFRMDWLDLLAVQGSSATPQFKGISSSALSFLHSPTLTSVHDHWKNHSLD